LGKFLPKQAQNLLLAHFERQTKYTRIGEKKEHGASQLQFTTVLSMMLMWKRLLITYSLAAVSLLLARAHKSSNSNQFESATKLGLHNSNLLGDLDE
jgi:hypothetical protein